MDEKKRLLNLVPTLMLYAEEVMRLYSLYGNIRTTQQRAEIDEKMERYKYFADEISGNINLLRKFGELQ